MKKIFLIFTTICAFANLNAQPLLLQTLARTMWRSVSESDLYKVKASNFNAANFNFNYFLIFYANTVDVEDNDDDPIVDEALYVYNSLSQSGYWYDGKKVEFKISRHGIFYKMVVKGFYDSGRDGIFLYLPDNDNLYPRTYNTTNGVEIDGITWAKYNVGAKGTFVSSPQDYGNEYTWDEAQSACPAGWRLPTTAEFEKLIDAGSVYKNNGREFGSRTIFLPAKQFSSFVCGYYWSSDVYSNLMYVTESRPTVNDGTKSSGHSVRCVAVAANTQTTNSANGVENYDKTTSKPPANSESLYALGVEHYNKKNYTEAVKYYRQAADMGNADAQNYLGWCYRNGLGIQKNETEAAKWYRKAAEQGNAFAQNQLGWFYQNGLGGIQKNETEAAKWYRKAAEQGDESGQSNLGWCYENGFGVQKNEIEAAKWYRKAAEQGDAFAQNQLGWFYLNGLGGIKKNETEAVKWYRKAAEQGNVSGQISLAWCYENGVGVDIADWDEAAKWYRKALAQEENADIRQWLEYYDNGMVVIEVAEDVSLNALGVEHYNKENYTEAVKYFRQAADMENAKAQYNLGWCYENGLGVQKNEIEAAKWFRKAAEQGDMTAQNKLGWFYQNGLGGIKKNETEAVKWYRKAAEQGQINGLRNLGWCYANGVGVEWNWDEAAKWYRKALEQDEAADDIRQWLENYDK